MLRLLKLSILFIGFVLSNICSWFIVLSLPWLWHRSYPRNIGKALSRTVAAFLGFDGKLMLSTELAYSSRFKWLRNWLYQIDKYHCEKSAMSENGKSFAETLRRDHPLRDMLLRNK